MYYKERLMRELAKKYPSLDSVIAEIASLSARLTLPKGTEHFMSDIHGEHEAFSHLCRNASGVIKRKIDALFSSEMTEDERSELATLIYYPEEKRLPADCDFKVTAERIIRLLELFCEKYTKRDIEERLRSACADFAELILDILLLYRTNVGARRSILSAVSRLNGEGKFIISLSSGVRALAIDRVHIVGDLFDRGVRADIVIDELMKLPSVDIEWGNHDVLWLGAAAGSPVCALTAVANSLAYGNTEILERGYGISLSPLIRLADECYKDCDAAAFMPKRSLSPSYADTELIAKMNKAANILRYKLEGDIIKRHPEYLMSDRIMLENVNYPSGEIRIDGTVYKLRDTDFPTVSPHSPCELTPAELFAAERITASFKESKRLASHARFLISKGSVYRIYNRNLLFHGCIPLDENHGFLKLSAVDSLSGRELMDECDRRVRAALSGKGEADFLWFLWCGRRSPLFARDKITSFEHQLIYEENAHRETKNPYYDVWESEELAKRILDEFSLPHHSHIINGHVPVKPGENPVKAAGRVIVIDGGFCSSYANGERAGYTLIYNKDGMRIVSHKRFCGKDEAIRENLDIDSEISVSLEKSRKILVRDVDSGDEIRDKISLLLELLDSYSEK